jgi:hypothetical protein
MQLDGEMEWNAPLSVLEGFNFLLKCMEKFKKLKLIFIKLN